MPHKIDTTKALEIEENTIDSLEYRLRFRAANKRNTDDIGLAVYHVVNENYYSPKFYECFMVEVKKEGKTAKAVYHANRNSIGLPFGVTGSGGFKTGAVTLEELCVMLVPEKNFSTQKMTGNETRKTMNLFNFGVVFDSIVEKIFDMEHALYCKQTVKRMTTSRQAQNVALFLRLSVCALIMKRVNTLKEHPYFEQ
eukprot:scaffold28196_cov55-Attheya_sp.AAC.3